MHSNSCSPKRANKMVKNGNKCQQITNNCKIYEITKYGEKMTTIYKNVKQCKKMPKMGLKRPKKWPNFGKKMFIVFWLETGTSHFHTMFGSRDMHFM